MPYPVNTFPTFQDLLNYINTKWVTNGVEEITGVIGNDVVNGLLTFIEQSPLNAGTADIASGGGAVNVTRPITVIMTNIPTSISWGTNVQNEFVFINTTSGNIPTTQTYYDINLTATNQIPAKSIVNIALAKNGLWIIKSVPSSGSGNVMKALVGVVGGGGPDDPANGSQTFQDNKLIGLGASNGGKITILLSETPRSSFGANQSFIFDNVAGMINLAYNGSAETFSTGSALWVDLNQ